jgi:hypothetical protein
MEMKQLFFSKKLSFKIHSNLHIGVENLKKKFKPHHFYFSSKEKSPSSITHPIWVLKSLKLLVLGALTLVALGCTMMGAIMMASLYGFEMGQEIAIITLILSGLFCMKCRAFAGPWLSNEILSM